MFKVRKKRITNYELRITNYELRMGLVCRVSCIVYRVSCFVFRVSCKLSEPVLRYRRIRSKRISLITNL
jgi:hypothetical protein